MAQASSAAREPSMEEILASIRRIIEDSDVSGSVPNVTVRGAVTEFRRPPSAIAEPEKQEISEKPAAVRYEYDDKPVLRGPLEEGMDNVLGDAEEDDIVLDPQNDDRRSSDVTPVKSALETSKIVMETVSPSLQDKMADVSEDKPSTAVSAPQSDNIVEKQIAEPELVKGNIEMPSQAPHILSGIVERQVSEAFEDLNHAVHAAPRRSFDEIATELLQPMLREWLDSNLPPLVERLVREEIERVVRGTR